jgi:tRNA A-37 threonylcarbamoyl transferase component Bud32
LEKKSGVQPSASLPPPREDLAEGPTPASEAAGGAFGRILTERGLATQEDLERCLAIQQQRAKRGDFVRLGAILVEEGILTPPQVAEILQQQAITVLACENCGAQYNVRRFSPLKHYDCRRCHGRLVVPTGKLENVSVQDAVEDPSKTAQVKQPGRPFKTTDAYQVALATDTSKIRQTRMLGRYEILGEIARGGMGVIYKGRQLDLDRVVALKTLRADESRRDDSHERFRREARAIAALRHPNIVAVHDVGEFESIPYFTMEFIEGLPLDRRIMKGPLPPREAISLLAPIAEAIHYCHTEGVVHRDLKPANIIVDAHGVPFLVDFGIAKRKAERGKDLDDKDELLGSIPYMPPEYVEGAAYDERCDVYSFGVVLYEVLAGHEKFPFFDHSTTRLLEKIAREPPVAITERIHELDDDLSAIVMKAIARDRADRYPTAGAFAHDLRSWLRGNPVAARPRGRFELALREAKRQAPSAFALVLACTTVGFGGLALMRDRAFREALRELDVQKSEVTAAALDRDAAICRALFDTARAREESGNPLRAIESLDEAVRRFAPLASEIPTVADVYALRGKLRLARGDKRGDDDLDRASRLDPRFRRSQH